MAFAAREIRKGFVLERREDALHRMPSPSVAAPFSFTPRPMGLIRLETTSFMQLCGGCPRMTMQTTFDGPFGVGTNGADGAPRDDTLVVMRTAHGGSRFWGGM